MLVHTKICQHSDYIEVHVTTQQAERGQTEPGKPICRSDEGTTLPDIRPDGFRSVCSQTGALKHSSIPGADVQSLGLAEPRPGLGPPNVKVLECKCLSVFSLPHLSSRRGTVHTGEGPPWSSPMPAPILLLPTQPLASRHPRVTLDHACQLSCHPHAGGKRCSPILITGNAPPTVPGCRTSVPAAELAVTVPRILQAGDRSRILTARRTVSPDARAASLSARGAAKPPNGAITTIWNA